MIRVKKLLRPFLAGAGVAGTVAAINRACATVRCRRITSAGRNAVGHGAGTTSSRRKPARATARAGNRVGHLVTINPTGLGGVFDEDPTAAQSVIATLVRSPVVGEMFFNALASRPSLRWFLEHQCYADQSRVTPEIVDHYYAVTHQPGARYNPATFMGGTLNINVARDLPFITAPVLVAWGGRAPRSAKLPKSSEFLKLVRYGSLVTLSRSGRLPHEEEPKPLYAAIVAFLTASARLPSGP